MQSALILIAPAFLAASIYMTLGRIIFMLDGEKCSLIRLKWLTKIFVAGDVLSFLMQASGKFLKQAFACWNPRGLRETDKSIGAGIMVQNTTNPSTGEHIIIGGLFVQIIFFGFFMISAVVFQSRIMKSPTGRSNELEGLWRRHLTVLYITSILILVRSIVRVVEYIQGYDGFLMKEEVFIYVFDGLLMLVAMLVLQYIHPSEINCLIGRGDRYSEKIFMTRKFEPRSALEMRGAVEA